MRLHRHESLTVVKFSKILIQYESSLHGALLRFILFSLCSQPLVPSFFLLQSTSAAAKRLALCSAGSQSGTASALEQEGSVRRILRCSGTVLPSQLAESTAQCKTCKRTFAWTVKLRTTKDKRSSHKQICETK